MGMLDRIRNFFNNSEKEDIEDASKRARFEMYEKDSLSTQIINLIDSIKRINSFDSSLWNYSNVTRTELSRKTMSELEQIRDNLSNRLEMLNRQSKRSNPEAEKLEEAKWTGQKPKHLSDSDFDRLQRSDDR